MHEVGLMQDALEIVLDRAARANAHCVRTVRLRIGEDSGVVPGSLRFAFEALVENTIAKDAELQIQTVPVRCYCRHCAREFTPENIYYECPKCDKPATDIRAGREFELVSVEVD